MLTKDKILKTIKQCSEEIGAFGVKKMGIFGSFSHSDQRPGSDIDVIVEFNKGTKTFDNYIGLKFYLEKVFHRKVDLVIKEALKQKIKKQVLSEVQYA
ncbi:MAG: nucleotidyltransferase family protein [Candidatus Omnitrophica bacterium]|nr:nucleotidyltransferase family protein [Candidatus Omnitrophota bacterium]